jgi:cathepsin B
MKTNYEDIKQELYDNGPMFVGFIVYEDFMTYSTGIYYPTTTSVAGGHAVKLIGWGEDGTGKLYWLLQN